MATFNIPGNVSPQTVHEKLREKLQEPLRRAANGLINNQFGQIYIMREVESPYHLKIGSCISGRSTQREKVIRKCKEITKVYTSPELRNYDRTEKLIQLDLSHLKRPYDCLRCSTTHGEWFDVDEDLAKECVETWVRFMQQQQPYTEKGELRDLWKRVLSKNHHFQPSIGASEESSHRMRIIRWSIILQSPSWKDYSRSVIMSFRNNLRVQLVFQFCWHITCFLLAVIRHLSWGSRLGYYFFIVNAMFAFMGVSA